MSSGTNPGRRRVLANQPDQKQGIKWDVVGLFSAIVPLVGTGILFIIGWAYQANWYGYFGVSMSQVNVQPQDVIIQSLPGVVTITSCLSAGIVSYYSFYFLFEFFKQFSKRREVEEAPFKFSESIKSGYLARDWIAILILTEIFLLIFMFFFYIPIVTERIGDPSRLWAINEITYMPFLVIVVVIVLFFASFLYSIIFVLSVFIYGTYLNIRSHFHPTKKVYFDNPSQIKTPQPFLILTIAALLIVLTSIGLSAIYGINDAANGTHTGTWRVQEVKVISSTNNLLPQLGGSYCYTNYCESLPFGLIGENDMSYILIRWDKVGERYFQYNSGIILLPRSEDVILVPYNYRQ